MFFYNSLNKIVYIIWNNKIVYKEVIISNAINTLIYKLFRKHCIYFSILSVLGYKSR